MHESADIYASSGGVNPRGIRPPSHRPRLRKKIGDETPNSNLKSAVIVAVDNPASPTQCTVLVGNMIPAQSGFTIQANLGMKFQQAPNPATVPPPGIAYWNNPVTGDGGSNCTVDVVARKLISIDTGVSTSAPVDYSALFQYLKHTGAYDSQHGFLQPPPVDVVAQTTGTYQASRFPTLSSTSPPNVVGVPTITIDHDGYPAYNATVVFTLDSLGTKANPALSAIQLFAVPLDVNGNPITTIGRVLSDFIAPLPSGYNYDGTTNTNGQSTYKVYVGAMIAGISYHIYIAYADFGTDVTNRAQLTPAGGTGTHPITITNLPDLGPLPPITVNSVQYPSVGATSYNAVVDMSMNYAGTNAHIWLEEIELLALAWDVANNRALTVNGVASQWSLVNVIGANDPSDASVEYFAEYFGLASGVGTTPLQYKLATRFVAFNGRKSAPVVLQLAGTDIVTSNNPLLVQRSYYQTMPGNPPGSAVTPVITTYSLNDTNTANLGVYNTIATFTTDALGTVSSSWLHHVELRAVPAGTSPVAVSGSQTQYNHIFEATAIPNASGQYRIPLNGLSASQQYDAWVFYVDYQGNLSVGFKIGTTSIFGSLLNGSGVPIAASTITPVISSSAQSFIAESAGGTYTDIISIQTDSANYGNVQFVKVSVTVPMSPGRITLNTPTQIFTLPATGSGFYQIVVPGCPDTSTRAFGIKYHDFAGEETLPAGTWAWEERRKPGI
jgi:hypothetical protein